MCVLAQTYTCCCVDASGIKKLLCTLGALSLEPRVRRSHRSNTEAKVVVVVVAESTSVCSCSYIHVLLCRRFEH